MKRSAELLMKILALEFSSTQRSVAVIDAHGTASPRSLTEIIETGGRASKAFELIETALREAQLEREQIDCMAIGLGPGSYTGIRSAIALAQGWQLASDIRLIGIGSTECLASQAQIEGITGRVHFVIDAQRNEFYLAKYEITAESIVPVEALRLATFAEILEGQKDGGIIAGPEAPKWFTGARLLFPRASTLGQLAATTTDFKRGDKLKPIYLRETNFVKAPLPRIFP